MGSGGGEVTPGEASRPMKTPMYEAMHAERYQRQSLIRRVENISGRQLICYVCGAGAYIDRDDVMSLVDLLHNVPENQDLDLMIHTPGGDIDAAEKLVTLIQSKVGAAALRVVVPDFAKSAGTLMALGSSQVVMSNTSELGPIDPQVINSDASGTRGAHPVQCYLDAYYAHAEALQRNPSDIVAQIMLSKMNSAVVKEYEAVKDRARQFAEEQLKMWMLKDKNANYTEIANKLMDTKRWLSHGQMIGWQAAKSLGLEVEYLEEHDPLWAAYWRLYCQLRLAIKDRQKIFESSYASLSTVGSA